MEYRRFGRTGLDISVLSAGMMRAMYSWQVQPQHQVSSSSQDNLNGIVREALGAGINHFETAHAYGTCEQQLGLSLQGVSRDRYVLQTKVQPASDPGKFVRDVHTSLARLETRRVDLLAIHGINDYRTLWQVCREGGCLAAARQLQQEGKVGWVGFSGHGPVDVITAAIEHEPDGGFDYVNLHWYYIFQANNEAIERAAEKDMGVFIISPTDKGGMLQNPPEAFRKLCSPLSPMTFNDSYCLRNEGIHTISIGAAQPADFQTHLEALAYLDNDLLMNEIDDRCRAAMQSASGHERPDALWSVLPKWSSTPGLINVPFILWLYNLARGWGLLEYGRSRYRKLGREVKWVPGMNGEHAARYDLRPLAEKAGLGYDELVSLLRAAHGLLGPQPGEAQDAG